MKASKIMIIFLLLSYGTSQAQEFKKHQLNDEDINRGVSAYYEYMNTDSLASIGLTLFKTGRYFYRSAACGWGTFSEGRWVMNKKGLFITSDIQKNDVPVKLNYLNEFAGKNDSMKIAIVINLKGESPGAFVCINNDSLRCWPMIESCTGTYDKIDSIKVGIKGGMTSKWIKVEQKEYKQLQIVLQLDFNSSSYEVFDNERFQVLKSSIRLHRKGSP